MKFPFWTGICFFMMLPSAGFANGWRSMAADSPASATAPAAEVEKADVKEEAIELDQFLSSPTALRLSIDPGFQTYQLNSSQSNIGLSSAPSVGYSFGFDYRHKGTTWSLAAAQRQSSLGSPTGVNPRELSVVDQFYEFSANHAWWQDADSEFFRDLKVKVGYRWATRTATQSSPILVASSWSKGGPVLGLMMTRGFDRNLANRTSAEVFYPNRYSESSATSGALNGSHEVELKSSILYPWSPRLEISVGLQLNWSQTIFSGQGSRGVTSPVETEMIYSIPLELGYIFD